MTYEPYSLTPKQAAAYFGIAEQTISNWISQGKLARGVHYLKLGTSRKSKVLIVVERMKEYIHILDGSVNYGEHTN